MLFKLSWLNVPLLTVATVDDVIPNPPVVVTLCISLSGSIECGVLVDVASIDEGGEGETPIDDDGSSFTTIIELHGIGGGGIN